MICGKCKKEFENYFCETCDHAIDNDCYCNECYFEVAPLFMHRKRIHNCGRDMMEFQKEVVQFT